MTLTNEEMLELKKYLAEQVKQGIEEGIKKNQEAKIDEPKKEDIKEAAETYSVCQCGRTFTRTETEQFDSCPECGRKEGFITVRNTK